MFNNARITRATLVVAVLLAAAAGLSGQELSSALIAKTQQEYVIEARRHLHQVPETRWEEDGTLTYIRHEVEDSLEKFSRIGTSSITMLKGGLVVDLTLRNPSFDRIMFRAEVDALPVEEATGLAFASMAKGKMHACGHDTQVAMLLGFLRALSLGAIESKHHLRLVFERAEENPFDGRSGAKTLVEEGVLDGIAKVYGLHIWVNRETGQPGMFSSYPEAMMANNDQFFVEATAKGGHGAEPHNGANANDILTAVDSFLTGFGARYFSPFEPFAMSKVAVLGGNLQQANVRPGKAEATYSFRTYLMPEQRKQAAATLTQLVEKVGDVFKVYDPTAKATLRFSEGYPVTANNPTEVRRIATALQADGFKYTEMRTTGSESFSYYLLQRPGAYFMLGAWQEGSGGHHSATFNPREDVLWQGVYYWAHLATN
ncbi:MAG: amidohydrolase [bacterium]|nr:amidohydrolase [bacterium]